jgi:hypothetical protein
MSDAPDQQRFTDLPILAELRERLQADVGRQTRGGPSALRRWLPGHVRLAAVLVAAVVVMASTAAAVVTLFPGEPPLPPGAVILAQVRGPEGGSYELAVAASRCPGWVHVELRSTNGYTSGGCGQPIRATLIPRVFSGGGGERWAQFEGTVSAAAHTVRVVLAGGGSITAPVYPIPARIVKGAGLFLLFADRSIEHAVSFQSLDAQGRVLATGPPPPDAFSHPVLSLPPGIVTVAHGRTPHGTPFAITLQRIRFLGGTDLCLSERPQGNMQCPPYPLGRSAPVFVLSGGEGSCRPPRYELLAGLLLRAGLTPWLRTKRHTSRVETVAVPAIFGVPGGVFHAFLTDGPASLIVRDRRGATVYSTPVSRTSMPCSPREARASARD